MAVLLIQLDRNIAERVDRERSPLLAFDLYQEHMEADPLVITAPPLSALSFPGPSSFMMLYKSPITGRLALSYSSKAPGTSMALMGLDGIVITGRARKLSHFSVNEEGAASVPVDKPSLMPLSAPFSISIGPAGENGVLFASAECDGETIPSEGLGYVLGMKNIKSISFPQYPRQVKEDSKANRRIKMLVEKPKLSKRIRKEGNNILVSIAMRKKSLPAECYRRRFDPRARSLDGKAVADKFGLFTSSCPDCSFSCRRRCSSKPVPSADECMMLGTNLGFYSFENVMALSEEAFIWGLEPAHLGALLAYLSENEGDYSFPHPALGKRDEHIRAIRIIGQGGNKLSKGLGAFPSAIQGPYHQAITRDLRGDFPEAIKTAKGLDIQLSFSSFATKPGTESAAALFLYDAVISYGLLAHGHSPCAAPFLLWRFFPAFLFRFPFAIRLFSRHMKPYGEDVLSSGFEILSRLEGEAGPLPDRFTLDIDPASDDSTVPYTKLMSAYAREKEALRSYLERREKRGRKEKGAPRSSEPSHP